MKTILIPTEDHDAMPAVLEGARLVAHAFGSYMEGFAVRPSPATYVTVEPVSSLAISGAYEGDSARDARSLFETFMHRHKVPQAGKEPAVFSYSWPREDPEEDSFIGSHGRVFDLIALGRPGPDPQNPRTPPLEIALFDSGRPVLIVPSTAPKTIGRNILDRLEPQHPAGAHQRLRAAAPAPRRESDRADGRRRHGAGAVRRGGGASPAPQRNQGRRR